MHTPLHEPIALGPVTAPNRLVMPPLVIWQSDESGTVTEAHRRHYAASVGPGLMIVEATAVAPEGRLAATQLGIWDDAQIDGLASLAAVIRDAGGLAGIQIHHAGGTTKLDRTYGLPPLVPSITDATPHGAEELTNSRIAQIIHAFRTAARRAIHAGFDVIELHGAHGYLISQFLSPEANRRSDAWGGTPERRRRFMREVIGAVRKEIDLGYAGRPVALTIRLGLAAAGSRRLPLDEGVAALHEAVATGIDFVDVSNGGGLDAESERAIRERAGVDGEWSATLLLASIARTEVSVPVVGVNGIVTAQQAGRALEAGIADLVAAGRAMLADPAWARKALGADQRPAELCRACEPRCFWFGEPPKCPARRALARRDEAPLPA